MHATHTARRFRSRPTAIALAIAGLLANPAVFAASTNSSDVTAGVIVSNSGGEFSIPVTAPIRSSVSNEGGLYVSADGSVVSGVMSLSPLSAGAANARYFVSTNGSEKTLDVTYGLRGFGGASSDAKTMLYTVYDISLPGQRLMLVRDDGSASLQTTFLTAPTTINSIAGFKVEDGKLSADGNAVAANFTNATAGNYVSQGGVYVGSSTSPLSSSSAPIYLLTSTGQYAEPVNATGNTEVKAVAAISNGVRVVGRENYNTATYWDVPTSALSVNASVINLSAQYTAIGAARNQWSYSEAISSDGSTIVGNLEGTDSNNQNWTAASFAHRPGVNNASSRTYLLQPGANDKAGTTYAYYTAGVSANGNAIAINGSGGSMTTREAFVWNYNATADNYTVTNIGQLDTTLATSDQRTVINALSADGSTAVGTGTVSNNGIRSTAFRWTASSGLQTVANWLSGAGVTLSSSTYLTSAYAVNQNGNVVVGTASDDSTNNTYYYLARVGSGSAGGSGLINTAQFNGTLQQGGQRVTAINQNLLNMSLYGAHHRALMDNGIGEGKSCGWATADAGANKQGSTQLGEMGVCGDFGNWRLGLGLGTASAHQDTDFGGRAKLNGQFLSAEADYGWDQRSKILSATLIYANWDASLSRGYLNGAATDHSSGSSDVNSVALRTRFDWRDALSLGKFTLSPYASLTHNRSRQDAYTETGGGFPVQFDARNTRSNEVRLGLSGKLALAERTDLRLMAESVNRLSHSGEQVRGQVIGLYSFDNPIASGENTWGRLGMEVDYRFAPNALVSASVNGSTAGGDAKVGGSVSVKMAF